MRRLRRWYIPACRGQRGPAGRASPQAGAGLRADARRGRRRPAARIAATVYVSPELYSLPVSLEFASLRPPLGGRTRLVIIIIIMRPSSLGGGRILRRTLSVRLYVCLSVRPVIVAIGNVFSSTAIVTDVLFGTH